MRFSCSFAAIVIGTTLSSGAFAQTSTDAVFSSGLGSMTYRVYLPAGYDPAAATKTPVVMYLHSAAERGNNIDEIFLNPHGSSGAWVNPWINHLVNETQTGDHKAILVIPQSGLGQVWNSMTAGDKWGVGNYTDAQQKPIGSRLQLAMDVLDKVVGETNSDTNRLYITGASMGAYGTWDVLSRYPQKFAAGMPVSGAGNIDAAAGRSTAVPVWAYHGGQDSLIPAANTDQLYFTMKQNGGNPLYSRLANQGHAGFDLFYQPNNFTTTSQATSGGTGPDVYDWLFSQNLATRPEAVPPTASKKLVVDINGGVSSSTSAEYLANGTELIAYNRIRAAGTVAGLKWKDGATSSISMTHVSGAAAAINTNDTSLMTAELSAMFPDLAARGFIGTYGASASIVWTIDGLDDNTAYSFDILSARTGTGNRNSLFILQGTNTVQGEINAAGNTQLLSLDNVIPLDGSIQLTLRAGTGNTGYTYFSGFQMSASPIPEPACIVVPCLAALALRRRRENR